jgi:hypothetical protein
MAVRTQNCTKEYLTSVALPTHAESYTVISHEFIINHTMEQLALHGFTVADEKYRANSDGSIAQGVYYLNYTKDPEVGMMFAWSNSYNKQMRFKCGIGGYVFICMNGVVTGDMGSYSRKHFGTADTDTINTIIDQISNADTYFDQILSDKDTMKKITLTERKQAELLGILYAEYEILTTEQMSTVKQQMDKSSYDYNCEVNSLWAFYNHVTYALKKSHPRNWMEDQRKLHLFISMEFDLLNYSEEVEEVVVEDPLLINYGEPENQLNILTEIEKVEVEAELVEAIEEKEEAEKDVLFYEDPAGNTFETLVVDDIKIHIESDAEYNARVAAIEGELELELPTTDQIIFEGLKAADDAEAERKEKTIDASDLISEYTLDEMPEVIEKLQHKIDVVQEAIDVVKKFKDKSNTLEEALEVEEVKPTETEAVDDFNFDLDDIKKDDYSDEFFL